MAQLGGVELGGVPLGGEPLSPPAITEPFRLVIANVDRTANYLIGTLEIQETLNARNTCNFGLVDTTESITFSNGEAIEIFRDFKKIFAGTIERFKLRRPLEGGALYFEIEAVDFNQLTDRFLLFKNYETEGQDLGDVVRDIVNTQTNLASEGVSVAGVQDGPVLGKLIFDGQTVRDAFDELASQTGFSWYIDYERDLKFFDRATYFAPFSITDANAAYLDINIEKTRERYRNVQLLTGGFETTDERTETFQGDGETRTFSTAFPIHNDPATDKPVITVASVGQLVGVRGVDKEKYDDPPQVTSFKVFYSKGEREISFSSEYAAPGAGAEVAITYVGEFPLRVEARDAAEIAARQAVEGGTGIYEHLEIDDLVNGLETAEFKVNGLLRQLGRILSSVEIATDQEGLKAGQLLTISLSGLGISGQYLINDMTISDLSGEQLRYNFSAMDGEYVGGWPEFFRKLFNQGLTPTLRENEVLILLRRITETLTASDALTYAQSAITTVATDDPYTVGMFNTAGGVYAIKMGKAKFGRHPLR